VQDRNGVHGAVVKRRLRGLGIRDRPIVPASPWQNAYVERSIGSIQRECIDHVIILGEAHLRQILSRYASYWARSANVSPQLDGAVGLHQAWKFRVIGVARQLLDMTSVLEGFHCCGG
jgi:hypothetical protein